MQKTLDKNGIVFDKYYWKQRDKLDVYLKENIYIMIDDDGKIIKRLSDNSIRTFYFRDINLKKLKETAYITGVNNWGDIYRKIIQNHT